MKTHANLGIARRLGGMIRPLVPTMLVSIVAGAAGHLAAIGLLGVGALLLASFAGVTTGVERQTLMVVVAVCAVARAGLGYVEHYFGHDVAFRLLAMIRGRIFHAVRRLAPAKLADKRSGDIVSTIMSDVEYIEVFFAHTVAPVAIGILVSSSVLWFVGAYWHGFALVLLSVYLLLGVFIPLLTNRVSRKSGRDYRHNLGAMNAHLVDSLQGLKELLLFGRGEARLAEIRCRHHGADASLARLRLHEGLVLALVDTLVIAAVAAIFLAGVYRVEAGLLSAGELLLVGVVAASSFGPVVALSALSNTLMQTFAAAERIFALLDEEPSVEEGVGREISAEEAAGSVEYRQVSFHYPGAEADLLSLLDLRAAPGAKVAVVGRTGSGKTTALRLLTRFWDPQKGGIFRNDVDIRGIIPGSLRANICVVAQDTFLFNATIADNIRLARPEATDREVVEAARRASLHDFIDRLPQGYHSVVGESGNRLSGGERQRLAIARALLAAAPVIVLDEPTSNLDVLNEKRLLMTLAAEFVAQTVIVVSHRPSTVAGADWIYVLEGGKVVEAGRHRLLLQQNGSYSRLMNMSHIS